MFGSSSSSSSSQSESSLSSYIFQEESACAKICPNLTYTQRIIGFVACGVGGYVLAFVGTLTLFGGINDKNITTFAILYVCGNVIALCATGFLIGPKSQCNKMWHPTRRYSTAFFLVMLIVVFAVALAKQNVWLILFLLAIEVTAGVWYGLSYVPFGRKILCSFFRSLGIFFPCFYVYDQTAEACKPKDQNNNLLSSFSGSSTAK